MASSVDIANLALYNAGSAERITSLDETVEKTELVRKAAFLYPLARNEVLEAAPWGCARRSVALALVTDITYPGWPYVYAYPAECVHVAGICDAGGLRFPLDWCSGYYNRYPMLYRSPAAKIPYEIATNAAGTGLVVLTDIANAYAYFVYQQNTPTVYSPLMVSAIAWNLGAKLASTMGKAERVPGCLQMADSMLVRAMAQMMNEAQQDPETDSPSIQVRG